MFIFCSNGKFDFIIENCDELLILLYEFICFIDINVLIYNQRTVFDVICDKRIFYSKITLFISIFFFFLENSTNLWLVIVQQIKRSKL